MLQCGVVSRDIQVWKSVMDEGFHNQGSQQGKAKRISQADSLARLLRSFVTPNVPPYEQGKGEV